MVKPSTYRWNLYHYEFAESKGPVEAMFLNRFTMLYGSIFEKSKKHRYVMTKCTGRLAEAFCGPKTKKYKQKFENVYSRSDA